MLILINLSSLDLFIHSMYDEVDDFTSLIHCIHVDDVIDSI